MSTRPPTHDLIARLLHLVQMQHLCDGVKDPPPPLVCLIDGRQLGSVMREIEGFFGD